MRLGLAIAAVGIALMIGAGSTYIWEHPLTGKDQDRALPKGSQTFGPVPQIIAPIPQIRLTQEALAVKARQLAPPETPPDPPPEWKCTPRGDWNDPNCPKADADAQEPVKAVTKSKAVVHHHKARHKRHSKPTTAKLKSKWVQPQAPAFSLERLFNVK